MASSTASSTSDVSRTTTVNAPTTISTHAEGRRSSAATTTGRSLVVDAFLRSSVRHQRSVLGFTPWRRATSAGFPPCSTSPTILVHSSRVRLFTRAIVAYPAPTRQPSIPRRLQNNLLFGNQNNYSGTAADGADYLKVDPMLDTGAPPEPRQGSPARRSSLASRAPAVDFYGIARGATSDRGCVQSP